MQATEDKPIACTLDVDTLATRLAEIRTLTITALVSHKVDGRVLRLGYRPAAASQVRRIVELEQKCCAFMSFEVTEDGGRPGLTITAPPAAADASQWLFAQFLPDAVVEQPATSCGCSGGTACD